MTSGFWHGKRVFVTGHTGFKGGWLSLRLQALGAHVHGFALLPPTEPNLYTVARVGEGMASSRIGDVRNYPALSAAVRQVRPQIVFHLAAQPLVRYSYRNPVETYEVNVMGLVHLLEAIRDAGGIVALVIVTSDKCYANTEASGPHGEGESLGGHDPYSSSKACAELVSAAYRSSFLAQADVAVATARAGNVIGGGDWAAERLLPDFFRALDSRSTLKIRSPSAIRPWQHVMEPVSGYLALAEQLCASGAGFAEPWNFGPADDDTRTVAWVVEQLAALNPGFAWQNDASPQPPETQYLRLDSSKARARLGWRPRWRLSAALAKTLEWHGAMRNKDDMRKVTLAQIDEYFGASKQATTIANAGDGAL
jgi:CDP-glucose 4,6-dehydratase